MTTIIENPSIIESAGNKPKKIEEFFGRVNSQSGSLSIAKMTSPAGWTEPAQVPEFDEYTVVLRGELRIETKHETYKICKGQGILVESGEWVRYSTPHGDGAEYIAVCLPAFSPDIVHREEQ